MKEIKEILELIAVLPDEPKTLQQAQALAKRALQQLKKIAALDRTTALALENKLRLLLGATTYSMLRPQAVTGLVILEKLEKACVERLQRKAEVPFEHGTVRTYGRLMSAAEFKRLRKVNKLQSLETEEMIPAFEASTYVQDFFLKIDKQAVRNVYSLMGGTGAVDYVVFFETDVVPTKIGPVRSPKYSFIIEAKFRTGTPVKIRAYRRI